MKTPEEKAEEAHENIMAMQEANGKLGSIGVSYPGHPQPLYCIVPSDLSRIHRGVQAAHGVAQYMIEYPDSQWKNSTLVVLKTTDMEPWVAGAHSIYREIHWGNRVTCCVYYGPSDRFQQLDLA